MENQLNPIPEKSSQKLVRSFIRLTENYEKSTGLEKQKVFISIIEAERVISLTDAVKSETLSFDQLICRNHADRSELLIAIASYIRLTCLATWNVPQNITSEQSIETASQLLDNKHWTWEDIIVFMKKAKKGEFGTVYNRIDTGVIMGWFWKYNAERTEAFEAARKKERAEFSESYPRTNSVPGLVNFEKHIAGFKRGSKPDEKYFTNK